MNVSQGFVVVKRSQWLVPGPEVRPFGYWVAASLLSIPMICPGTNDAALEQKKIAAPARLAVSPTRPGGGAVALAPPMPSQQDVTVALGGA